MPSPAALLCLALLALSATASPVAPTTERHRGGSVGAKQVIIFGDSLTDVGNGTYPASNFTYPPAPYYKGRYSNGQVWIEYLTQTLGASLTSYATGGATSVNAPDDQPPMPIPSVNDQISKFIADFPTLPPACSSLYMVWIGGNDIFDKGVNLTAPEQVNAFTAAPGIVANYITKDLQRLVGEVGNAGGKKAHIALLNLPTTDLVPAWRVGHTPAERALLGYVTRDTNARLATDVVQALRSDSPYQRRPAVSVSLIDTYSMFAEVINNYQQYGFTDGTNPCIVVDPVTGAPVSLCSNPDDHLFWDHVHPTTKAHKVLADKIYQVLQKDLSQMRC
ncbi:hypothetical protein RI367_001385 [Sorochytrium milnesiophthora]